MDRQPTNIPVLLPPTTESNVMALNHRSMILHQQNAVDASRQNLEILEKERREYRVKKLRADFLLEFYARVSTDPSNKAVMALESIVQRPFSKIKRSFAERNMYRAFETSMVKIMGPSLQLPAVVEQRVMMEKLYISMKSQSKSVAEMKKEIDDCAGEPGLNAAQITVWLSNQDRQRAEVEKNFLSMNLETYAKLTGFDIPRSQVSLSRPFMTFPTGHRRHQQIPFLIKWPIPGILMNRTQVPIGIAANLTSTQSASISANPIASRGSVAVGPSVNNPLKLDVDLQNLLRQIQSSHPTNGNLKLGLQVLGIQPAE